MRVRPWMLVSAAWTIPSALAVVNQIAQRRIGGQRPPDVQELLFAGGDWLLYAFLTPMVFAAAARWPIARPNVRRHAALHVALSLLFCAAWAGAGTLLRVVLTPKAMYYPPAKYFVSWLFITFPFGVAVYLCVVGIEHATRYFVAARERDVQMARLSEQLSTARFAALQAQTNPHFLFNTLNTIAVLVRDGDRGGAVRIIEHLSSILRRTLARRRSNEVTLAEELDLIRAYLAIESARFSDRLQAAIDVAPAILGAAVPSLVVQHLVENAIRHGIAKHPDAGRVGVSARRVDDNLQVVVTDDGAGLDDDRARIAGHGLANTRERLHALYGDRASLSVARGANGGTIATLTLPYHAPPAERDDDAR